MIGLPLKDVSVCPQVRGQNCVEWIFYPIFLLRFGSSLLMWMASLASLVIWKGSLSIMLKSEMWWAVSGGDLYNV